MLENTLIAMSFRLRMDREIIGEEETDENKRHFISPGSYEITTKKGEKITFDFLSYSSEINEYNKKLIDFYVSDYDETYSTADITDSDIKSVIFNDFYVYTGEKGDPELSLVKIDRLSFHFLNGKTINASQKTLGSINRYFREELLCG